FSIFVINTVHYQGASIILCK
ncbi:TPA: erythromycin resistance leader peptide, partial [Enterococcus faecium]